MNLEEIIQFCDEKKQTGDYQTLARVLKVNVDTARTKIYRKEEQAVRVLFGIIQKREEAIIELQN